MGADLDVSSSVGVEVKGREEQRPLLKNGEANNDAIVSVPPAGAVFGFNYGNRPYRDIGFSIAFILFLVASLGIGILAGFNQNPEYKSLGSVSYDSIKGCTLPKGYHGAADSKPGSTLFIRNLSTLGGGSDSLTKVSLYVALATLILLLPVAFGLLWILRKYTKAFVYITLPFFVIIPVASAITLFVLCSTNEECVQTYHSAVRYFVLGFILCINVLFLWVLYKNWDRVELTIRIIRTASEALHQNRGLLLLLPSLNVGYLLYIIPAAYCIFLAYTNGQIAVNPELVQDPDLVCGGNSGRPCCVWETDDWVLAYIPMALFVILWGLTVMAEIQVFTISGTISQWYFATSEAATVGSTKRSLLHAVGPSFGSVCLAGLVVAFIRTIRSAIESSKGTRGDVGFLALLVRACLLCLLSAVEFLTKFTTNFAAITGESFCASAKMTYDLLRRNLLSTLVVESVTGRLLLQAVLVLSVAYGLVVFGGLTLLSKLDNTGRLAVTFGAFVIILFFLAYFVQVLHNVVDTVYICFAMDKDSNEVTKPEVHDVYVLLPAADDGTASLAVPKSSSREE